jgi:Sec-independent protein secretion pathway component TatC
VTIASRNVLNFEMIPRNLIYVHVEQFAVDIKSVLLIGNMFSFPRILQPSGRFLRITPLGLYLAQWRRKGGGEGGVPF